MTDKTLPDLTENDTPTAGGLFYWVDGSGNSRKITFADLKTAINTDPTVVPSSEPYRGARAVRTSNLSMSSGTFIQIAWQSASSGDGGRDTDSFWSAGAPTRLTIPAGISKVRLTSVIGIDNSTLSSGQVTARFQKNGSDVLGSGYMRVNSGDAAFIGFNIISDVLDVVETDYFEVRAMQSLGSHNLDSTRSLFAIEVVEASV